MKARRALAILVALLSARPAPAQVARIEILQIPSFNMEAKHARLKDATTNRCVDPEGYRKSVADREAAFRAELARLHGALDEVRVYGRQRLGAEIEVLASRCCSGPP